MVSESKMEKLLKIKQFFKHELLKSLKRLFYVFYFMRYPFLQPRNVWSGKKYWDWDMFEFIPKGWRKAFGKKLKKDLRIALKRDGILKTIYFIDIKEKYGTLCLYTNGAGPLSNGVIRRYEELSRCYCIKCGKPARYQTDGWINYLCEKCFDECIKKLPKDESEYKQFKLSCRLTKDDIPHIHAIVDGEEVEVTYDIDYKKLWGLEE